MLESLGPPELLEPLELPEVLEPFELLPPPPPEISLLLEDGPNEPKLSSSGAMISTVIFTRSLVPVSGSSMVYVNS